MKFMVVSTWNKKLYKEYAHRFLDTYNWPFPLLVYNEDGYDLLGLDLFKKVPECLEFVNRNKNRPVQNYRYDGVRFCYKTYSYTHAILNMKCDGLIYMDADSIFHVPIDEKWIKEHIHRNDCMMSYLGRVDFYSETGFLYFNLNHPYIEKYALEMKRMYDDDEIYTLDEQSDSYVCDYVRMKFENEYGVKNHNIGDKRHYKDLHVQARSILGTVYDHLKGNRKEIGQSMENIFLY